MLVFVCACRHGVHQFRTGWADGPEFVTQCPIRPGGSYTYRFTITGQEGTLWWHAHSSWLRATVYGALIISPRLGTSYPFTRPHRQIPIVLGMLQRLYFLYPSWNILLCLISISCPNAIEKFEPCLRSQENGGIGILLTLWTKQPKQELPRTFQMHLL